MAANSGHILPTSRMAGPREFHLRMVVMVGCGPKRPCIQPVTAARPGRRLPFRPDVLFLNQRISSRSGTDFSVVLTATYIGHATAEEPGSERFSFWIRKTRPSRLFSPVVFRAQRYGFQESRELLL